MADPPQFVPTNPRSWLARYVQLMTPKSEAPAETHTAAGLALLSAAIGWRAWIEWGLNREPVTVWPLLTGQSAAARKSTASASARDLARRANVWAAAHHLPIDPPPLRGERVGHMSNRGLLEMVAPANEEEQRRRELEPPPGLLLEWDEFGGVLGDPGEVKGEGWLGQLRAAMMSLSGGRSPGAHTGAKLLGGRCAVAILGTVTRRELESRVHRGLLVDGFMGRFILVPYAGRRCSLSRPPRWTQFEMAALEDLAGWVAQLASCRDVFGDVMRRMSDAAGDAWDRYYHRRSAELEARADTDEAAEAEASMFQRLQTVAVKVAACMAISEWNPAAQPGQGGALGELLVEREHIDYGIGLAEHALAEVVALAGHEAATPEGEVQRAALEVVASRNGAGPISMRDLLRAVRSRGKGLSLEARKRAIFAMHPEELVVEPVEHGGPRDSYTVRLPEVTS